jgi:aspartyl-tRNA(Asn)/glutamyl-tRNA(Gln) amidotransferase subunit B
MELETIIGLEIHVQLNTKSKLWCSCDNDAFGAEPNTRACPVCMGFPGMLPVLNEAALKKAVRGAAALGCKIQKFSKFDRKNYFYPDLPTGYQISQFDQPISLSGSVEVLVPETDEYGNNSGGYKKKIGITRVHLENDAGKLNHVSDGSLVDFNRAGSPLAEIVSDPDLRSALEAEAYAREVQKIFRFVDASDADMEKGMMRFDASVSLRPKGEKKLYPRSEIKNLNSFVALIKAINYEVSRQKELWEKGQAPDRDSTVGWRDEKGITELMRLKESSDDYRYFPEPDLPPVTFTEDEIEDIEKSIPELPLAKFFRYRKEFKLTEDDARTLSEDPSLADFFEKAVDSQGEPKKISSLLLSVVLSDPDWKNSQLKPDELAETAYLWEQNRLSSSGAKQLIEAAMKSEKSAEALMKELSLEQVSDTDSLGEWIDIVIKENPKVVEDYKSGKEKVVGFLVGQVMQKSKGSANPPIVQKMMKEKLSV